MTKQVAGTDLPRRTQQERRSEAERRLLESAAELIAQSGTSGLTLAAVGENAGYSRGIVRHHFGSKAALMKRLVDAVHREFFESLTVRLDPTQTPLLRLRALIASFGEILADLPPLHRAFLLLWADASSGSQDVREGMARSDRIFRASISELVQSGQEDGSMRMELDSEVFATALVGTLRGVALLFLIDPEGIEVSATFSEIEGAAVGRLTP